MFRAKTLYGKWFTGYSFRIGKRWWLLRDGDFLTDDEAACIDEGLYREAFEGAVVEIDPKTLAYDTTVKDKDGKRIWGSIEVDGEMSRGGDRVEFTDNPIHEGVQADCVWVSKRAGFYYEIKSGQHRGKMTDVWDTWRKYKALGPQCEQGGEG